MWRPNDRVVEDISDLPGNALQNKRRRSRRRAWRDGLADQTVVRHLENVRSYRAFERTLVSSVDPRSVLELALVHRLASLLWRLHRASAIETGLFEIQGEFLLESKQGPSRKPQPGTLPIPMQFNGHKAAPAPNGQGDSRAQDVRPPSILQPTSLPKPRAIAECFLRLSRFNPGLLDRVGSYEARLWRQAAQIICTLDAMRRPPLAPTRRPFRNPVIFSYWDAERSRD
jgi:hypothetical protein